MKLLELKSLARLLALVVGCAVFTGCHSLYVDKDARTITINSNPQGAYVWDSTGKKLLGQTPMQFTKAVFPERVPDCGNSGACFRLQPGCCGALFGRRGIVGLPRQLRALTGTCRRLRIVAHSVRLPLRG